MTNAQWLIVDLMPSAIFLGICLWSVVRSRPGDNQKNEGARADVGDCSMGHGTFTKDANDCQSCNPPAEHCCVCGQPKAQRQVLNKVHGGPSSSVVGSVDTSNHSGVVSPRPSAGGDA